MSLTLGPSITIADALDSGGTSISTDVIKGTWTIQVDDNTLHLELPGQWEDTDTESYDVRTPSGTISLYTGESIGYPILDTIPMNKGSMILNKSTQYGYVVSKAGYIILNRGASEYEVDIHYKGDSDQAVGIDITPDTPGIIDTIATYLPQVSFSDDPDSIIPNMDIEW